METNEALSELEKSRCRENRRQSVQFIDKNLIRRRSAGQEKYTQHSILQQSQLPSITGEDETETNEIESQQPLCERPIRNCFRSYFSSQMFCRVFVSSNLISFPSHSSQSKIFCFSHFSDSE